MTDCGFQQVQFLRLKCIKCTCDTSEAVPGPAVEADSTPSDLYLNFGEKRRERCGQ